MSGDEALDRVELGDDITDTLLRLDDLRVNADSGWGCLSAGVVARRLACEDLARAKVLLARAASRLGFTRSQIGLVEEGGAG